MTGDGVDKQIAFFTGTSTLDSEATGFAWDYTNNKLGIGDDTPEGIVDIDGAATGQALLQLRETGDQNIITATASSTTVFNLTRNGLIEAADLTLGLNDTTATIATYDTNEDLTLDPNGTGDIYFHGGSYSINDSGQATFATDETINGIDISSGAVSDVVDLAMVLGAGNDITIDAAATDNTGTTGIINLDLDATSSQQAINLDIETITDAGIDTLIGLDILATQTSTDDDIIYGIRVQNLAGLADSGAEYGIYQAGTSWDYGWQDWLTLERNTAYTRQVHPGTMDSTSKTTHFLIQV
ncbi:MAG: hypothetical protein UT19_C0016G0019 [Candidatus Woesebacteria bacterium GW2011_GWB1_39_10b]|uniref:Uncharacterized protein n=1 Tax=Candidatus Woesebacteria bacterium GW2011_GWB1_39_10b TaxID=1618573 RepID=A0A0G0PV79_9BACT|nr:MAG: hypothetical protein UT19_C0016G0019 [Candidatus Woesebacteria bacterium GW2011_GWB1_39_10b]